MLNNLPDDLVWHILYDWLPLSVKALTDLDVAFCNRRVREWFLTFLSGRQIGFSDYPEYASDEALNWVQSRGITIYHLRINATLKALDFVEKLCGQTDLVESVSSLQLSALRGNSSNKNKRIDTYLAKIFRRSRGIERLQISYKIIEERSAYPWPLLPCTKQLSYLSIAWGAYLPSAALSCSFPPDLSFPKLREFRLFSENTEFDVLYQFLVSCPVLERIQLSNVFVANMKKKDEWRIAAPMLTSVSSVELKNVEQFQEYIIHHCAGMTSLKVTSLSESTAREVMCLLPLQQMRFLHLRLPNLSVIASSQHPFGVALNSTLAKQSPIETLLNALDTAAPAIFGVEWNRDVTIPPKSCTSLGIASAWITQKDDLLPTINASHRLSSIRLMASGLITVCASTIASGFASMASSCKTISTQADSHVATHAKSFSFVGYKLYVALHHSMFVDMLTVMPCLTMLDLGVFTIVWRDLVTILSGWRRLEYLRAELEVDEDDDDGTTVSTSEYVYEDLSNECRPRSLQLTLGGSEAVKWSTVKTLVTQLDRRLRRLNIVVNRLVDEVSASPDPEYCAANPHVYIGFKKPQFAPLVNVFESVQW